MITRKFAAVAMAAGLLLSTSACSFNPHPDSLQSYAPSDGSGSDIELGKGEGIKLRNFLYLTDGTDGALLGVLVNSGKTDQTVTINYTPDEEAAQSETVVVKAYSSYSFGFNGAPASQLELAGAPGDIAKVSFGFADNSVWTVLSVPILDGTYDYYKDIVNDISGFLGTVCVTQEPVGMDAGATPSPEPTEECVNPTFESMN
ncbi:MAG: hypothetical protein ACKOWE_03700 [Micrococcales bacterium]